MLAAAALKELFMLEPSSPKVAAAAGSAARSDGLKGCTDGLKELFLTSMDKSGGVSADCLVAVSAAMAAAGVTVVALDGHLQEAKDKGVEFAVRQYPGLKNASPTWRPFSTASHCECCSSQFGAIRWKHHCRECGGVICGSCSKGRKLVRQTGAPDDPDHQPDKHIRVCLSCELQADRAATERDCLKSEFRIELQAKEAAEVDVAKAAAARKALDSEEEAMAAKGRELSALEGAIGHFEWLDGNGEFTKYPADINLKMHTARSTGSGVCQFIVEGQAYTVHTQFPMHQTNAASGTHRHVRLAGGCTDSDLQPPLYWHPGKGVTGPELVLLDRSNMYMQDAWDDAVRQLHSTVPGAAVLEVSVLQDAPRWKLYNTKKRNLASKLAGDANEHCVFHATSEANTSHIAALGFLRDYNKAAAYGTGTYFARDASYSANPRYSPPNSSGEKFMFLARALIGEPCVGTSGMGKPTQKTGSGGLHESMVDRLHDPTIFVLSAGSDEQTYAEFLIKFKKA
jgi:poly [ADP-ribose] polymerase 10/14/15